eukprot:4075599-Alexandrium_andersonii.AAC.1
MLRPRSDAATDECDGGATLRLRQVLKRWLGVVRNALLALPLQQKLLLSFLCFCFLELGWPP